MLYHGPAPKLERQHIICEYCGETNVLLPVQSVEWSLFKVRCESCAIYVLLSKFFLKNGVICPRCNYMKIWVLERYAGTEHMIQRFKDRGFEVWQYTHGGAVKI